MSGQTPNQAIPYGTIDDTTNTLFAVQAMATRIDTLLTAAKVAPGTLSHNTGLTFTTSTGWGSLDYYWQVRNGVMFLRMEITRTGATLPEGTSGNITNTTMCTMTSSAYQPALQWTGVAYQVTDGTVGGAVLNTDGGWVLVSVQPSTTVDSGDVIRGNFTYPI